MNDDFLRGIPNWFNEFNKIDRTINSLNNLETIAAKLNKTNAFFDISNQLSQIAIKDKIQHNFGSLFSSPFNFHSSQNKYNSIDTFLNGDITTLLNNAIKNITIASTLDFASQAGGIYEKISANNLAYEKQLSIASQLSKSFFLANHLAIPDWVEKMKGAQNFLSENRLRIFDILSADTFIQITENEKDNATGSVLELDDIVRENVELKKELETLYLVFAKKIAKKVKRKRKKFEHDDLIEPQKILTKIVHKYLLGKFGCSLQTCYIFVVIFNFAIIGIFLNIILEAKGADMFDSIFGSGDKLVQSTQDVRYLDSNVNDYYAHYLKDTVIENANIYLRNSTNTKRIGRINANTVVLILQQKPKWCFIEAIGLKPNKVSGKTEETVIRGWILKKHLAYFQ